MDRDVLAETGGSAPDRTIMWSARDNPQAGGWQRARAACRAAGASVVRAGPRRPCAVLRQVAIKQKPSEAPGQQSPCRLIAVVTPTLWRAKCVKCLRVDGSWDAGAAAAVPVVCRTSAGG